MPLLSIVTAALAPTIDHADYLLEAYESLALQEDLGPWEWEWLIQEDGETPALRERLPDDPRIVYAAHGALLGIATSRNLALERARGTLVRVLDSDDILMPRGLAVPLELLDQHPQAAWAAGECWRLLMPRRQIDRTPVSTSVPAGLVRENLLAELLLKSGEVEIHGAGLTIRTDVLRSVGGWMAVPYSETIVPLVTVNATHPGAYSPEPTFLYRRWPSQITQQDWLGRMKPLARSILWQRLHAINVAAPQHPDGTRP
ncbi:MULTISPECIES: glycosyltransferase family 2 protein [unclassified Streptomyces]|uniref:glycosyltransferase family 2 protein n=1 Tax=unclassified Streptomyces TaxID=2593676 RepID=UPI0013145C9C|nr:MULTISPECIES: glycosyltransferase family A protein [unclassified Streptomyces]